MFPRGSQ